MKIACDKCLKVKDSDNHGMLRVSTEHQTYFLCKECEHGFWQAVDYRLPKIEPVKGGDDA